MKWKIDLVSCDLCLCHVQIETSAHCIKRGHKAVLPPVIEALLRFTAEAPSCSSRQQNTFAASAHEFPLNLSEELAFANPHVS